MHVSKDKRDDISNAYCVMSTCISFKETRLVNGRPPPTLIRLYRARDRVCSNYDIWPPCSQRRVEQCKQQTCVSSEEATSTTVGERRPIYFMTSLVSFLQTNVVIRATGGQYVRGD